MNLQQFECPVPMLDDPTHIRFNEHGRRSFECSYPGLVAGSSRGRSIPGDHLVFDRDMAERASEKTSG